jgi:NADPH:quinone reductase
MRVRAVVMRQFGDPAVLMAEEWADPAPGEGEALIDVELANITFVETQIRAGRPPSPAMLPRLPAILGNGVGGVVAAVGPGVDVGLRGRRVVASLGGAGGYAQRAVASADRLVDVPGAVGLADAVALLADGRTALSLLRLAGPLRDRTVVVEAAAGGVGSLLVQLARAEGARVVALAGGPRKLDVARDLGADLAVDYRGEDWPDQVRRAVGPVDVVFDGVGGAVGLAAFGLLGAGGRLCRFGMASGAFAAVDPAAAESRGITVLTGAPVTPRELTALSREIIDRAAGGRPRPLIGQRFDLADAAAAHAAIEARRTVGKTLLVVG